MSAPIVTDVSGLTAAWVSEALGAEVTEVVAEQVGTGQIGTCYRLRLTGQGVPTSVLVKLPAAEQGSRDLLAGAYRGELIFYADIAPTVRVRVPTCHFAAIAPDSGDFTLVMEDLAPAEQGDQIAGCTVDQAREAVVNLAGLHGPRWSDPTLEDFDHLALSGPEDAAMLAELAGPTTELFIDGLADLLAAEDVETLRACVPVIEAWTLARPERFALVHGDYRLDNLMFAPAEVSPGARDVPAVVAVDWQTLSLGLPARDLAYFVGTSLDPAVRASSERDLVAAYHAALTSYGVSGHSLEECWDDYRFAMVQGPLVATFGCAYGTRSERGDRMFATMVARSCAAIRELGTLDLV
ncbi:aminoglycoside phosphotransferase [Nocardioides psychrotolerans]|uniref:Ecdysteroid kinase n=1 Tax=Nocardioides psychrotolerans TaxID=1005945 RepID=A0A1I3HH27_9ACTN|nr:phosphotransferase [Nocardioides psychrotolerans]GEP37603.1 aminoglycoside phosphotransferase [Nocardioides psychrotolerans]SFI34941.1 Ecdysteroid kinase [Nocardioides psychrotolerans]